MMAPPGRRKATLLNFVPLFLLCLLATSASAAPAVLGIDLGTEYIKAAIAKPGRPIEIVLTKDSKRKEAAALAFKPARTQKNDQDAFPERLYGGDALALSARFPTDVYMNLKSILGLEVRSPEVKQFLARYPGLRDEAVQRQNGESAGSTMGFTSKSFRKDETFMVEELLAMQLKNIKANAEAAIGKGNYVSDVVITYPSYYSAEEKRAIELATELAGLRLLGLISDGLAVGLNYATHRTFDSITIGGKPEHHIVYDMGAGSTTATVLRFQGRTIKGPGKKNQTIQEVQVLGIGSDRRLGGDSLNDLIVQDMISKFIVSPRMQPYNLPSIEVRKHGKTMARLWKDAERVRQVLSANSIAHTTLEGLYYEDVTSKYSLTREDFEALAKDYASRIAGPLNEALLMADLRLAEVDSVILHGGMVRTPFVQKQLEDVAGGSRKIKTNVNADEAAVMGAAFKAASISPTYRVKDIRSVDVSCTAYTVSWDVDGKAKEQKIFVPTSQIGIEKQLAIRSQEDSTVTFRTDTLEDSPVVLTVQLTNLTKSVKELKEKYGCVATNITTLLNLRLASQNGIPELTSGTVSCKPIKAKEGSVMDNVKGLFGIGKKDQEVLQEETGSIDSGPATPLPVDDPTSSGTVVTPSAAEQSASSSASSSSSSAKASATPTVIIIPLSTKAVVHGLNTPPDKGLPAIRKRLTQFDVSDRTTVQRAEALNILEAFTYRAKARLEEDNFLVVSTAAEQSKLSELLSFVSDWLYGDGIDATLEELKAKLKGLKDIVEPILKRENEGNKREDAVGVVRRELTSASMIIDQIRKSMEAVAKDAAASASSAAAAAAEAASATSVTSSTTGGELDEDPYATSSSAPATESSASPHMAYEYTEEDLSEVTKAYETLTAWLAEKLALQEKLTPRDEPAVLVADLESKAQELQKTVTNLIMKPMRYTPPKAKKSKAAKKEKSKGKKSKSVTSSDDADPTSTTTTIAPASTANEHVRDEL